LKNRRDALVLTTLGFTLLVILAALLWPAPAPAPAAAPLPARALAQQPPPAAAAPDARPPPSGPKTVAEEAGAIEELMRDPEVLTDYLRRYREANRYAPTTVALLPGMQDALEPFAYPAQDQMDLSARNLHTRPEYQLYSRFEADKVRYTAPEPIQLRLALFRGKEARTPEPARVSPVRVRRLRPSGGQSDLGTLELRTQADGLYTATYQPPRRRGAEDDDVLLFEVDWEYLDGKSRPGSSRVLVQYTSSPPAFFTGRFHERLEGGSLLIDVEVDSQRAGPAQVSANLFAADGRRPVAFSTVNVQVEKGRGWVTLEFYGLVFHDRGLPGPYVLQTLRGHFPTTTSAGRGAEFISWPHSYRTRGYALTDFTPHEWDSPRKREGIKAYEEEIARLRAEGRP
jgi:hypothetical protein